MSATGTNVETEYRNRNRSGHWFDRDTLAFFKSRIGDERTMPDGSIVFITSEKGPTNVRAYTVRMMDADGDISDIGEFQEHTRSSVRSAFRRAVADRGGRS